MALTAVIALGIAAIAVGTPTAPTLIGKRTALKYPSSTRLVSTTTTTSAIMKRIAGASDWTTFAAVPSGVATTWVNVPTSTAEYQVVSADGATSTPVTITVAALLTDPATRAVGHKGVAQWVRGDVTPRIDGGSVTLTFWRWQVVETIIIKRARKTTITYKFGWVKHGDAASVPLKKLSPAWSKWAYQWTPTMAGRWKVVVSEQDIAHTFSSAHSPARVKK